MTSKPLILCAVSGGADSICMLHLLWKKGENVACAHYHHGMRGADADADEKFVRDFCRSLGVPFYCEHGDVYGEAERTGEGVEECGRRLRYEFFHRAAEKLGAELIATAHNADDQSETVLMRLLRGAGSLGLSGIPETRGNIIRPILHMSRASIEAYIAENGLEYIYDSTNSDDRYVRNLLRHQVMPVLKEINPNLNKTLARCARLSAADEAFLGALAEKFLLEHRQPGPEGAAAVEAEALAALEFSVASRALRKLAGSAGLTLSEAQVRAGLALAAGSAPSASADVKNGALWRCYGLLCAGVPPSGEIPGETPLNIPGETPVPGTDVKIICKIVENPGKIKKTFNTFYLSKSIMDCKLTVRGRRTGDGITLPGRRRRSLKKLMCDMKLPAAGRELIPVVAADGRPAAVMGVGMDQAFAAGSGPQALELQFIKNSPQGGAYAG